MRLGLRELDDTFELLREFANMLAQCAERCDLPPLFKFTAQNAPAVADKHITDLSAPLIESQRQTVENMLRNTRENPPFTD